MATDEKKGGFFSRFKKGAASEPEAPVTAAATPPAVQQQSRNIVAKPAVKSAAVKPAAATVPASAETPEVSDAPIDTIEAFNVYCGALVDIGTSQLRVMEMALSMFSNSLNKIMNGPKTGE